MNITNVIEVTFGSSHSVSLDLDTAYLYNSGIYLKPTDLDLPESYQVHFANSKDASTSLEVIGTEADGALIPYDVWETDAPIYAWYYLHPTEDSAVTAYAVQIFKHVRAGLPDGTEPTPSEQTVIDQAITALNNAVDACEDARDESATNVTHYPIITDGYWYVWDAENSEYVNTEVKAEGTDGVSITSIEKTATSDLVDTYTITFTDGTTFTYAVTNGTDGDDGKGIASIAKTGTSGLVDTYTVTFTDGTTFDYTVTNGQDGDTGATPSLGIGTVTTLGSGESATATITGTDENPVLNLGIPKGADGDDYVLTDTDKQEIAEIVEDDIEPTLLSAFPTDTASGAVASFTDGADDLPLKFLVVNINPVQDLHGQDSPYPAGGGKNKIDFSAFQQYANWTGALATYGDYPTSAGNKGYLLTTVSGTTYTVSLGISSSSFPTYCYLCRANGADTSERIRAFTIGSFGVSSITFTAESGWIYYVRMGATSTESSFNAQIEKVSNAQLEAGSTATSFAPYENICPISGRTGANVTMTGKNLIDIPASVTKDGITFTKDSDGYVTASPSSGDPRSWGKNNAQFLVNLAPGNYKFVIKLKTPSASQYSGWEIYSPTGVKIAGSSGGKFRADEVAAFTASEFGNYYIMAKLHTSVSRLMVVKDGADTSNYEPYSSDTYSITFPSEAGTVYSGKLDVLTGILTVYPEYDSYNGETLTGRWISDRDVYAVGTTPTIGAQVVNIGAEGTEYQLTAQEVSSLLGDNNIYADCGDTTVEYRADPTLYIQRLTVPDSYDMVADANITSGQYFMVGNNLYIATANIANGSAIVVGTNCTRKSLAEALNEINA